MGLFDRVLGGNRKNARGMDEPAWRFYLEKWRQSVSEKRDDENPRELGMAISDGDAETHYELAIEYRKFGMINDTIAEFEKAAQDPDFESRCRAALEELRTRVTPS
jgi:hypothetical protein